MIFTLTKNPIEYYSNIRNHMTNCYLAEDVYQIIIGIDCDYVDSNSYSYDDLQKFYYSSKEHSNAPFAGLFGVFAYETIHYFENINEIKNEQYKFPTFLFANAKAYLHYDKNSKIYTFYGDKDKYLNLLENTTESNENEFYYNIESDLGHEKEHFYNMVEVARDYIKSGDIFQVVLSSQLKLETNLDSLSFYKELSIQNPSPYMFHFPTEYGDVVGSSPEILVQIENEEIFIAPIAGTRPRGKDSNEDDFLSHDLLNDEKECAEHRMLIDLARNDVGKFAESGSVVVRKPMHIQYYQHVMHIVSEVYGKKRKDISLFDIISIVFPAGTLSGAPKIRAMEIIAELEEFKRHIYGGGLGFLHFNGNVQLAIIIRTGFYTSISPTKYNVYIQAGAGVVYDSIKEKEYAEITHKRQSLMNVFKTCCSNKEVK